jgi:hypothetical protein
MRLTLDHVVMLTDFKSNLIKGKKMKEKNVADREETNIQHLRLKKKIFWSNNLWLKWIRTSLDKEVSTDKTSIDEMSVEKMPVVEMR